MNVLPLLDELQIIARNGLTYDGDPHDSYDKERYERILHLVSEWYGRTLELPPEGVAIDSPSRSSGQSRRKSVLPPPFSTTTAEIY